MEKKRLSLSIYSGMVVAMLFCCQCKQESDPRTKEIKEYLKAHYNAEPEKEVDRIYVINDFGCGNCILSLSEFVKQNVTDDRAMIIIHSRGANVDLSTFEGKRKQNRHILINHEVISDENNLFYHSGVVYFKDAKVGTVVHIQGEKIASQLQYIFKRENQR